MTPAGGDALSGGPAGVAMRATHSVAPGSASYAKGTYWDDRYAERETNFDWFFVFIALLIYCSIALQI